MRTLAILFVLVLAGVGAHALDQGQRKAIVRDFAWSQAPDLARVQRYEPHSAATCSWRSAGDLEALIRALITVESLATPKLVSWWRSAIAVAGARLSISVPNLTYGPGRVRLSTARMAVRAHGGRIAGQELPDAQLATWLLDYCATKQIVSLVVKQILALRGGGPDASIDLESVRMVARIYNGQSEPRTPEAAIAHETYTALVYALFQHYRFEGLGETAPH